MSRLTVLAIESSCDETAIAVMQMENGTITPLLSLVSSQVALHAQWGGVVPNLAAREHLKNITPLLSKSFTEAGISPKDIDVLAVTNGPGLIPALLVGVDFAKTLAYIWKKPLIGVHHIEGHIYANFVANKNLPSGDRASISKRIEKTQFPALALVVSGGHTQLIYMRDHLSYEVVGQTLDDAVGEAFDKVARILSIGYPGGPVVAKRAEENTQSFTVSLPRPMLTKDTFDFSFSGLKTAVLYETKKNAELLKNDAYINAVCKEFQQACIDVLVAKTIKAAHKYLPKTILLAGGVSANTQLRAQLEEAIKSGLPETAYKIPDISLTGDNAAMIGAAACIRWLHMNAAEQNAAKDAWRTLSAHATMNLT